MNIGIDGYEANVTKRVGISRYAHQLLSHLYRLDHDNSYTIFLPTPLLPDMPEARQGWKYRIGMPGSLWTLRQLPPLVKKEKLQLFFSPTHYVPWFISLPKIAAIMDLSYLHFPDMFRVKDLLQLRYMGWFSVRKAKRIVTISEFTKKEIVKNYGYPATDIAVTYPGVDVETSRVTASDMQSVLQKYKIMPKFILFVGTIQPRKNISRLIAAFEMLDKNIELVLVGKKGWRYGSIFKAKESSSAKSRIKYLDFVSDKDLARLYAGATCFTLPSLYEGFGIPVVEAMNYGTPVVVSTASSLPEVAGNAGIYVDPLVTSDIARGLATALQLTKEQRQKRIELGKKQASKFTWDNCAKKTIEVFDSIA